MSMFSSRLILGATPTPQTEQALRIVNGFTPGTELSMQVFEVTIDRTIRYCCWAGGSVTRDSPRPQLTPAGRGALEALMRLPHLYDQDGNFLNTLVFQGVALGKTPIPRKIAASFRMSADVGAIICFVGDLAKELDGHVGKNMNIKGVVNIGEISGMRWPGEAR